MTIHPLFRTIPGMADIDKREAKLKKQQEFRKEAWRTDNERYEREEANWKQKVLDADEAMEPRPKRHHRGKPDPVERRDEVEAFRRQRRALEEERVALIGAQADALVAQLLDLEADVLSRASAAVAALDAAAPEIESLRNAMRTVNLAAGRSDRTGGGAITAGDLISVARGESSFLAPTGASVEVIDMGGGVVHTKRTPPKPNGMFIHHRGKDYPSDARTSA